MSQNMRMHTKLSTRTNHQQLLEGSYQEWEGRSFGRSCGGLFFFSARRPENNNKTPMSKVAEKEKSPSKLSLALSRGIDWNKVSQILDLRFSSLFHLRAWHTLHFNWTSFLNYSHFSPYYLLCRTISLMSSTGSVRLSLSFSDLFSVLCNWQASFLSLGLSLYLSLCPSLSLSLYLSIYLSIYRDLFFPLCLVVRITS